MRANKVLNYESILQVLDQTGYPFCRFMKTFQAELLQDQNVEDIQHLCNFHTWSLAASPQATFAAGLFLDLLNRGVLGHAAEFMVSQRELHIEREESIC